MPGNSHGQNFSAFPSSTMKPLVCQCLLDIAALSREQGDKL